MRYVTEINADGVKLSPRTEITKPTWPQDDKARTAPHGDPLFPLGNFDCQPLPEREPLLTRADVKPKEKPKAITYRVSIALKDDETTALDIIDCTRIANGIGDLSVCFGFGQGRWGAERCALIETAISSTLELDTFLLDLLRRFGQKCAYVNVDGVPWEFSYEGCCTPITGEL